MNSPTNDSTRTSLAQLFSQPIHGMQVQAIEIPLFQRDYAQGRNNPQVQLIRERFITSLCDALDSPKGIDLDFVFGDVVEKAHGTQNVPTLYPLDGQQRLTTLFLLHCYLAWHIPETKDPQSWHAFSYSTRPGARAFCKYLTVCRPDMAQGTVSEWLKDQTDYLPTWKHDPTIQGMLVMLDALHARYSTAPEQKRRTHWERLIDPIQPAIRFHLLPIRATCEDNTLYVKMNSRGRALTDFENFKADLEALVRDQTVISDAEKHDFSLKIDTVWTDLFWAYQDKHNLQRDYCDGKSLIDAQFMRYLRFLFEVRAWRQGKPVLMGHGDLKALTAISESLMGGTATDARANFEWIVQALNVWLEDGTGGVGKPREIGKLFSQLFTLEAHNKTTPLRIFNFPDSGEISVGVDLFRACCMLYGTGPWKLPHTVLLYGVLQGLIQGTESDDLHLRLRLLRNLIEASRSEIRADTTRNNMPDLLKEVEIIMAGGPLTEVKTFNKVQVRNEQAKQKLLQADSSLLDAVHRLEDHELLRGGLSAFDLNPTTGTSTFADRAKQFAILFNNPYQLVSAALLAKGNKGRVYPRDTGYRLAYLGAPRQAGLWEDHWRIRSNEEPTHPSSTSLMGLLDDMTTGLSPKEVIKKFVKAPDTLKDWRYYLAKYEVMRDGEHLEFAGTYVIAPDFGYAMCMPKTDSCDNRSHHHDAYLLALAAEAGLKIADIGNPGWPRCFPGNETNERHLVLRRSRLKIRCVRDGWALSDIPTDPTLRSVFDSVASERKVQGALCVVPQINSIDDDDRIKLGADLLRDLIAAGF